MNMPAPPALPPLTLAAARAPRRVLSAVATVAVLGLLALRLPHAVAGLPDQATATLHTVLESFYVGGATAIFCVAWYAPRQNYPLPSTLIACLCVPLGLLAALHLAVYQVDGATAARLGAQTRLSLMSAVLAAALAPPAKSLSNALRLALLGMAVALTLWLAWTSFAVAMSEPLRQGLVAAGLIAAFLLARRRVATDAAASQIGVAAAFAGLAEACFAVDAADASMRGVLGICGHAFGLLALEAMFFAVYREAIDAPYRSMEQARRDAQIEKERVETIVRSIADGVVVVDGELRVASMNPVAGWLFGATEADHGTTAPQALQQLAAPVCAAAIVADVEACLREGRARTAQAYTELRSRDGLVSTVEHSVSPIRDSGGRVRGAVLVLRDVTTRKVMEELLIGREEQFRTLAENSPDIIVRYDRDCRCLYVNATCELLAGMPARDLLRKTPTEAAPMPMPQAQALQDMVSGVVASRQGADLDLSWQRKQGDLVSFSVRAAPEFDDAARVVSVLTVARDITAMKQTERRLRESRAQLRELSARREEAREEERKRIAHDLHEELGQTLTALRIAISTLSLQYGKLIPDLQEKIRSMLGLVDQTIDGMREAVTSLRPTTLDAGLAVGLEWLVHEFQAHTLIVCGLHLPEDGLDFDDARATAAFRIVQEALTNIARHAQATRADVSLRHEKTHWLIKVRDNGCGFDVKRPRDGGSGIHDMWERALMLNGEFSISSSRGLGTVIKVLFPQGTAPGP
jgi:PAS domain S-box-containing protein